MTNKQTKLFTITGFDGEFMTGGNIQMYPQNTQQAVERMAKLLDIEFGNLDEILDIVQLDEHYLQYPEFVSIRFLL